MYRKNSKRIQATIHLLFGKANNGKMLIMLFIVGSVKRLCANSRIRM